MNKLFTPRDSVLRVWGAAHGSERDCQEGFHMLTAGVTAALRNPKSHSNEEALTADEAMRRIMFASMLMWQVDDAVPVAIGVGSGRG